VQARILKIDKGEGLTGKIMGKDSEYPRGKRRAGSSLAEEGRFGVSRSIDSG